MPDTLIESYAALTFAETLRYLFGVGLLLAVGWTVMRTRWRTRRIQAREATMADRRREILASARTILIYGIVATAILLLDTHGLMPDHSFDASGWSIAGHTALMLVAHDAWFYWSHRTMHHRRLFKAVHLTHHRSVTPTPFAAYAFSWSEAVVEAAFVLVYMMIVPVPAFAVAVFMVVMIVRNAWGHVGIEIHPRWWADHPVTGLLTTTVHHDLHHAGGLKYNYGLYFTWWDRMMGTEHPRYRAIYREVTNRPLADRRLDHAPAAGARP